MTIGNYIFYVAILIGNVILVAEWAKYGLLECATVKNSRFVLGMVINTAAIFIASISGNFPNNQIATMVVIGITVVFFFGIRLSLPPGRFLYNKASQRIIHWYPTHYSYGKVLSAGEMLKKFSLAQNTAILMETAINNMPKKDTVSSKLDLALSHEWLGVLYRMMNEFEKARKEFNVGLSMLEGLNTKNMEVKDALGHVIFRLAELDHIHKRYKEAILKYKKSLIIDESLGLQQRVNITKMLIQQITDKSQEAKRADIYEILMDAICCVMYADERVTSKEREAVHNILGKAKAPWTKEDIDKRIDGFLDRAKKNGIEKIVQATCVNLPEFKRRKKQEVLAVCLDFMARADGLVQEKEKQLIEKFKSAVEIGDIGSPNIATPVGTPEGKEIVVSKEKKEVHAYSGLTNAVETNKSTGAELPGESIDQRIDRLWESAKSGLWTGKDCERKISIYTEILGIIDKSTKYNAAASLHNRAICYRNLKKYDEALNDLQKEMEIARKINDSWRIMECRKLTEQVRELKKNMQIKAAGGDKAGKIKSMEQQAEALSRDGTEGDAAFESLFADLQNADPDIRAEASKLLSDDRNTLEKSISIYHRCLNTDTRKSILAGRVLGRKIDGGKQDMIHAQTSMIMYGLQVAFTPCVCGFCSKLNVGIPVPEKGLYIPFYGQTDDKHGAYALPVLCDHCGKEFFIAWDSDPR